MAWITPTALAISAAAGLGSAALNASRSPQASQNNQALQYAQLLQAAANQQNQARVQALINQRSVAGQTDSFGSSIQYDPSTNTWNSTLGPLPQQAQTAAQQAAISRNTTDLRAAEFANQQAALRATQAGGAADAAQRNLATFRPMSSSALTGMLDQQATDAQQMTFRPMIADTLRQFARTGTAAGPVLGQIGRSQEQSLRDSLIDAQIKGIENVGDINNQTRQGLESQATTTAGLANPTLQFTNATGSGVDNTLAQVVSQRAAQAGVAPAQGMFGANSATANELAASENLGKNLADPNFGISADTSALSDIQSQLGPSGTTNALVKLLQQQNTTGATGISGTGTSIPAGQPTDSGTWFN